MFLNLSKIGIKPTKFAFTRYYGCDNLAVSQTVKEKLDDDQPREYLSEIRQCTILFINLVFDLKVRLEMRTFHFYILIITRLSIAN